MIVRMKLETGAAETGALLLIFVQKVSAIKVRNFTRKPSLPRRERNPCKHAAYLVESPPFELADAIATFPEEPHDEYV